MTTNNCLPRLVLSTSEVAETLSVCNSTVRRMIQRGDLERVTIGKRRIGVPVRAVEKYIAAHTESNSPDHDD